MITAGTYDLLVRGGLHRATSSCSTCVSTRIRAVRGVRSTETFIYLKLTQADLLLGRALTLHGP